LKKATTVSISRALELIDLFEQSHAMLEKEATELVGQVFNACGQSVKESGFIAKDGGVDCHFELDVNGRTQRLGVELKLNARPADVPSIDQAFALARQDVFDRIVVISKTGFTERAIQRAREHGLNGVDLFGIPELRNWVESQTRDHNSAPKTIGAIRSWMLELARIIATDPKELFAQEWRDMERIIGASLEAIGFEVLVTRPAKDGGFDVEVRFENDVGENELYLIEVKHWTNSKPGTKHLTKLIEVTANRKATGGFLLSTNGFTSNVYQGVTEIFPPVNLGTGQKLVAICQAYERIHSGLWTSGDNLKDILFDLTVPVGIIRQF
jgi:hypothetical protein